MRLQRTKVGKLPRASSQMMTSENYSLPPSKSSLTPEPSDFFWKLYLYHFRISPYCILTFLVSYIMYIQVFEFHVTFALTEMVMSG